MKNLMNCAKKVLICFVMVVVFGLNSIVPSYAVEPGLVIAGVSLAVQLMVEARTEAEKADAIRAALMYWDNDPISTYQIDVPTDEIFSLCLALNEAGFPCRIVYRSDVGGGSYCIEGYGYVTVPGTYLPFDHEVSITGRVYTNADGEPYCCYSRTSSNQALYNIYGVLDEVENYLSNILSSVRNISSSLPIYVEQITTNAVANTTTMVEQITTNAVANTTTMVDQITTNADVNAAAFVDKLGEVIVSADENFTTVIESINSNGSRLDTLIEEVRKISTYDDRHEVETIIPGVFGDYDEIILRGGWEQVDRLGFVYRDSFSYDDPSIYWESIDEITIDSICPDIFNVPYGSYTWAYDLDYENLVFKFSWGANLEFSNGHEPFEAVVYSHSGDYDYTYLSSDGGSFYVPAKDFNRLVVSIADDGLYYYDMNGPGSLVLSVSVGQFNSYGAEEFNVTVDGRSGQYFFYEDLYGLVQNGSCLYYDEKQSMWKMDTPDGGLYDVSFSDELTALFTPPDRTVVTIVGEIYSWFEWFYNDYAKRGGLFDVTPIVNKLKDIENTLSNMGSNIDIENNTNININEENENYNIFYVDDPDGGEDKSIVDLSGDTLKVFGQLLDFLYKVGFKGALDDAGGGIGDLSDFYLDTSEGSADLWVS